MTAGRVLVTGASSGIGAAISARLVRLGWAVIGVSRHAGFRSSDGVPAPPAGLGEQIEWQPADLADRTAITALIARLCQEPTGRFDALVHAAGLQMTARLGALETDTAQRMWAVHVQAPMMLTNALIDRIPDGGRVLLIGSRTAAGAAGKSQYAATKAAMQGLCRSWAMELLERRICVNVLAPGPTITAMTHLASRSATPVRLPPFGRMIDPDEVAQYAEFLLGPGGAMITGQHMVMCGGTSLVASP